MPNRLDCPEPYMGDSRVVRTTNPRRIRMVVEDLRTEEFKQKRHLLVVMRDSFLSKFCPHGTSYAAWACEEHEVNEVERWVRSRGEARNVRVVDSDYVPSTKDGSGHYMIYMYTGQANRN